MATSPINTLAHVFLPNLVKLKGPTAYVQAIERKDKAFFAQTWTHAFVEHDPKFLYTTKDTVDRTITFRVGIISMPEPKDMGDAHMIGVVVRHNDAAFGRLFLLEHDWVLKTKTNKTIVTEREGHGPAARRSVHWDGPALTGNFETDAQAFMASFMEILVPTKVKRR